MIISDDKTHDAAMIVLNILMDAEPDTDDEIALEVISSAVEEYEKMRYPLD